MQTNYNGSHIVARDYDSIFIPATIFQCSDMNVTVTKKMVEYDTTGQWIEHTVGYNGSGEIVYTISGKPSETAPSWVPNEIKSLLE